MRPTVWILSVSLGLGLVICPRVATGQERYRPARPTLSPWLGLGFQDPGPLGPYLSYVRPELELRETLRQQDARLRRQGTGLQGLQGEVSRLAEPAAVRPTGTGSVFMNYSHFYPGLGSSPGSRAARTSPRAMPSYRPPSFGGYGSIGRFRGF